MTRTMHSILFLSALLAACNTPPVAPAPPPPATPQVSVVAPPAVPPSPAAVGPACVVSVLVGGQPSVVPHDELAAIGHDAIDYLGTCRDRADRPQDALQWDSASSAPVCVRLVFAPPAELRGADGPAVTVGELLVPLGAPHLEGFVFARAGDGPHATFLAGDPALLARLKQEAAETLAITVARR